MKAVPIAKNSRLHPIISRQEKYPILLDENGNIPYESKKRICKRLMGSKSDSYDKYRITLKFTNEKFSTKQYGN